MVKWMTTVPMSISFSEGRCEPAQLNFTADTPSFQYIIWPAGGGDPLSVDSGEVFHSLDELVDGGGLASAGAVRYRQSARHLRHLVTFQVEESLDQITVDEAL